MSKPHLAEPETYKPANSSKPESEDPVAGCFKGTIVSLNNWLPSPCPQSHSSM